MGINLESSDDGLNAFVVSSENDRIKSGHLLVAVNQEPLEGLSFEDILEKVGGASWPRTLSFTTTQRKDHIAQAGTLPLPDDFFSDLAALSNQEEEYIKEFMNKNLEEALRVVTSPPEDHGMRMATESDGIKVFLGDKEDSEGEKVQMVLSQVQIPIPADLMMNAAVTCTRGEFKRIFTMLDPMFGDGDVLHVIPKDYERYGGKTVRPENLNLPLYSVKWGAWMLPFPLYNRDFVFCEYTCWAENGYGVSMCMSIPKISEKVKNLEESHSIVRGHMGMTGYFWKNTEGSDPKKPVGKNAMSIDLTYLLQINIKGAIPKWAVNLVGPQQGLNVKRVRDYALKQRDIITHFFDKNTELNGFEVLSATIDKGTSFQTTIEVPEGSELVFEWVLEDYDISFSIQGPDGSFPVPAASHSCSLKTEPYQDRFTAKEAGVYTLKWDNSSSWFTSKTVFYHQVVVDPADPQPWPKWPTREEAFAAE
ncbi:Retinal-binding protein [Hondaea fermentalgiana]|uniref:Retinal-binding protein n=1 Tax=Hondaea fermentalgiana TaxID=2315210 RepID=A0A2R5GLU4_9STRA|nr:Retinal-binding protein [Hondaea fermentalgiana]|eukprot:GBG31850.1 Retinal-binding protein [Hondaea fermentalgiana]